MNDAVVYVSEVFEVLPKRSGWRYSKAAHLWCKDEKALEAFARQLQLNNSWKHEDHYDLTINRRVKALELGAVPIRNRELVELRSER